MPKVFIKVREVHVAPSIKHPSTTKGTLRDADSYICVDDLFAVRERTVEVDGAPIDCSVLIIDKRDPLFVIGRAESIMSRIAQATLRATKLVIEN